MISTIKRPLRSAVVGAAAVGALAAGCFAVPAQAASGNNSANTATPIKHVVVIFSENVSFDHYFATYPNAANTDGTRFTAAPGTPTNINTLQNAGLMGADNPNAKNSTQAATDAAHGYQPHRLAPSDAWTTSQGHGYTAEQTAENGGAMDNFSATNSTAVPSTGQVGGPGVVMGYYDGNTVTAMWNYAQNYAMSDNSWDITFGPSTVGALNLVAGQTGGTVNYLPTGDVEHPTPDPAGTAPGVSAVSGGVGTTIGDPDPVYDDCSDSDHTASNDLSGMQGQNIGDLLNAKGVTWGWFQGGFRPTTPWDGTVGHYAQCDSYSYHWGPTSTSNKNSTLATLDYSPHHEPFQYYASTANPHHLPPSSVAAIGTTDQANHQYDITDFNDALAAGNLPAVSFLKAPAAQDGHPSNSTPLDEQKFFATEINALEKSPFWSSTAVVIAYDDSDGWYDHQAPTITNASNTSDDRAICTAAYAAGAQVLGGIPDRCGPSQRLPLLVISPYSKKNYVDHVLTNQASVLKFIEDNWGTGRIGGGSFDESAGSILGMLDFAHPQTSTVLLSTSTGAVIGSQNSSAPSTTTKTALHASASKRYFDQKSPEKLTATVTGGTGTLSGSVAFYDGSKKLKTVTLSRGAVSYSLPQNLKIGTHHFKAVFTSANTGLASNSTSGTVTVTVVKATSRTSVKYASGRITVTVTANTPVAESGKVRVYDGRRVIKTASVSKGKVTFSHKLKKGTHRLKAVYLGSSYVSGSTSHISTVRVTR